MFSILLFKASICVYANVCSIWFEWIEKQWLLCVNGTILFSCRNRLNDIRNNYSMYKKYIYVLWIHFRMSDLWGKLCVEFTLSWIKSLTTRLNNSNIDYSFMDMNQTIPKPMFNVSLVHLVNQFNKECTAFSPFCKLWCSNNYVTIWTVNRSTSMCTLSI